MINEHDIEDYKASDYYQPYGNTEVKLYDLLRDTYFTFADSLDSVFKLHNIDGMYSYCTGVTDDVKLNEDGSNSVYHFAAWTPVILLQKKVKNNEEVQDKETD